MQSFAQKKAVEIIKKQDKNIIQLFVKNNTHATQSLRLTLKGYGFELDRESQTVLIIPAKQKILGATITLSKTEKSSYSYNTRRKIGNVKAKHTKDYKYGLPYAKDKAYKVMQGYNGIFSHKDKQAIDFDMPVNTPVYASREGVVVKVKKNSKKGCPTTDCIDDANFIMIEHSDGTIGEYVHLRYRGISVKEGMKVKKGQKIGFSGNTGFSSAPHLHFEVFIHDMDGNKNTVPTLFEIEKDKSVILKKGDNFVKS
ncbi:M23 family metallopeptidase [Kordia sp.]|uniref:M23 family metallopeptidase n=1 Tax=Kordia sp. TaxID=1965332 RepID=UPI003B59067C